MVDFKNCVIIMTSNLGSYGIENSKPIGFSATQADGGYDRMKEGILEELKKAFRPEFLNRLDDIIVFHKLSKDDIKSIAKLMLDVVQKRLSDRDIFLSYTDEAVAYLAEHGFDESYGARPLRRMIQQLVEDELSEEILAGTIKLKDKVQMYIKSGKPAFKKVK